MAKRREKFLMVSMPLAEQKFSCQRYKSFFGAMEKEREEINRRDRRVKYEHDVPCVMGFRDVMYALGLSCHLHKHSLAMPESHGASAAAASVVNSLAPMALTCNTYFRMILIARLVRYIKNGEIGLFVVLVESTTHWGDAESESGEQKKCYCFTSKLIHCRHLIFLFSLCRGFFWVVHRLVQ